MPDTSPDQVRRILGASLLLDALPQDDLDELVTRVRVLRFEAGETIFSKGAPGTQLFWVVSGRVKLTVESTDGSELLHSMLEGGDHFGEITAVDGGVRGVNAIAYRRCVVLVLDRKYLIPAWERTPKAAMNLAKALCAQVRVAGATLENLAFNNSEGRIFTRLMLLGRQYGSIDPESGSMRINHGLSQKSLADSVGLTRVMVNRQLSAWRALGLTEDGRGFIVIRDVEALEAHAMGTRSSIPSP